MHTCRKPFSSKQWPCGPSNSSDIRKLLHNICICQWFLQKLGLYPVWAFMCIFKLFPQENFLARAEGLSSVCSDHVEWTFKLFQHTTTKPSNSSDILQLNLHWPPWTTTCWPPPPPWSSPCLLVNDLIHHQIHDHLQHNCLIFKFENILKEIKNFLWGGNCPGWKMSQKKEVAKVRLKSYNFQSSSSSSSMVGFCHWQIPTMINTDKIPP